MISLMCRAALCATVSSCLIILPAAVASATTIEPVRIAATDQGDGSFAGTATCPAGKRVVFGGFDAHQTPSVVVNQAQGQRAWKVRAFSTDRVDVIAYCSAYLRTTAVSKRGSFREPDRQGGATATCPAGTSAIAGGWRYSRQEPNSPVYTSMPLGARSWKVYAASSPRGNSIIATAYCLSGKAVKVRESDKVTVTGVPSTGARRARDGQAAERNPFVPYAKVSCAENKTLFGGGFETQPMPDFGNSSGPDTFFRESDRHGGNSWRAQGLNFGQIDTTIRAFAVCRD